MCEAFDFPESFNQADNIQLVMELKLGFLEEIMLFRRRISLLISCAPAAKAVDTVIKSILKGVSKAYSIQEPIHYCIYFLSEKNVLAP